MSSPVAEKEEPKNEYDLLGEILRKRREKSREPVVTPPVEEGGESLAAKPT
jgi:hypothetical protein